MNEREFDWNTVEKAVPEQAQIAVYSNEAGCAVIRMDGNDLHDDDPFVVVQPRFLRDLILSLEHLADQLGV